MPPASPPGCRDDGGAPVGCARVATGEQAPGLRIGAPRKADRGKRFTEAAGGAKADRAVRQDGPGHPRAGDTLVVRRLDRPGRPLRRPIRTAAGTSIRARKSSFFADLWSVAIRALRALPREPAVIVPSSINPVFFAVDIGTLQDFAEPGIPGLDFRAFQLPTAIIFAATGVPQAAALVTDIQSGYFDRMPMTPKHRLSFLLGFGIASLGMALAALRGRVERG